MLWHVAVFRRDAWSSAYEQISPVIKQERERARARGRERERESECVCVCERERFMNMEYSFVCMNMEYSFVWGMANVPPPGHGGPGGGTLAMPPQARRGLWACRHSGTVLSAALCRGRSALCGWATNINLHLHRRTRHSKSSQSL